MKAALGSHGDGTSGVGVVRDEHFEGFGILDKMPSVSGCWACLLEVPEEVLYYDFVFFAK